MTPTIAFLWGVLIGSIIGCIWTLNGLLLSGALDW